MFPLLLWFCSIWIELKIIRILWIPEVVLLEVSIYAGRPNFQKLQGLSRVITAREAESLAFS